MYTIHLPTGRLAGADLTDIDEPSLSNREWNERQINARRVLLGKFLLDWVAVPTGGISQATLDCVNAAEAALRGCESIWRTYAALIRLGRTFANTGEPLCPEEKELIREYAKALLGDFGRILPEAA